MTFSWMDYHCRHCEDRGKGDCCEARQFSVRRCHGCSLQDKFRSLLGSVGICILTPSLRLPLGTHFKWHCHGLQILDDGVDFRGGQSVLECWHSSRPAVRNGFTDEVFIAHHEPLEQDRRVGPARNHYGRMTNGTTLLKQKPPFFLRFVERVR